MSMLRFLPSSIPPVRRPSALLALTLAFLLGGLLVTVPVAAQQPLGTAFTYHGYLEVQGSPPSSLFDMEFRLYDGPDAATSVEVGSNNVLGVSVVDGRFSVQLDFPAVAFDGTAYWLQVSVSPVGQGTFTNLAPLQRIAPTPYALYSGEAGTAADAESLGGVTAGSYLTDAGGTIDGRLILNDELCFGTDCRTAWGGTVGTDYVDLTTAQTVGGAKTFTAPMTLDSTLTLGDALCFGADCRTSWEDLSSYVDLGSPQSITGAKTFTSAATMSELCFGADCRTAWPDLSGFVDLSEAQTIDGAKTFTAPTTVSELCFGTDCRTDWSASEDVVTLTTDQTVSGQKTFSSLIAANGNLNVGSENLGRRLTIFNDGVFAEFRNQAGTQEVGSIRQSDGDLLLQSRSNLLRTQGNLHVQWRDDAPWGSLSAGTSYFVADQSPGGGLFLIRTTGQPVSSWSLAEDAQGNESISFSGLDIPLVLRPSVRIPGTGTGPLGREYLAFGSPYNDPIVFLMGNNQEDLVVRMGENQSGDFTIEGDLIVEGQLFASNFRVDQFQRADSNEGARTLHGTITTDSTGTARVDIPETFVGAWESFHYQLTVKGTFAQAIVGSGIEDGEFVILTDQPLIEVSWQVVGEGARELASAQEPLDGIGADASAGFGE